MNALEKVVDLLVAVTVLFLLPLLYYGSGMHVSKAVLAGQAGENFLTRVSTAGEITLPVWNELEYALNQYGAGFSLQRERSLFEPSGEDETVVERVYTQEKEVIWKQMKEKGRSCLQAGDRLWLTIYVNGIPTVYRECVRTGGG